MEIQPIIPKKQSIHEYQIHNNIQSTRTRYTETLCPDRSSLRAPSRSPSTLTDPNIESDKQSSPQSHLRTSNTFRVTYWAVPPELFIRIIHSFLPTLIIHSSPILFHPTSPHVSNVLSKRYTFVSVPRQTPQSRTKRHIQRTRKSPIAFFTKSGKIPRVLEAASYCAFDRGLNKHTSQIAIQLSIKEVNNIMPPIRTIPPAKVVKVRYINGKTLSMSGILGGGFFFHH